VDGRKLSAYAEEVSTAGPTPHRPGSWLRSAALGAVAGLAVVLVEAGLAVFRPVPGVSVSALDLALAAVLTATLGGLGGLGARLLWRRQPAAVAWVPLAALVAPQLLRPLALPYAWDPVLSGALLLSVWLVPRLCSGMAALVLLAVPVVVASGLERGAIGESGAALHIAPGGERPDILLITVDTLRSDAGLALPEPETWRSWDQAVSGAPWTLPAMISLFSGQPVREHMGGLPARRGGGYTQAPPDTPWLPVALAERGYTCAAFTSNPYLTPAFGFDRGFQHFVHADSFREPFLARRALERLRHQLTGRVERLRRERDTRVVRVASAWLERPRQQPRFTWVHLLAPHEYSRDVAEPVPGWTPGIEEPATLRRAYRANVGATQALVARLLGAVDPATTVVAFTADHGEQLGEAGVFGHGLELGDAELRVPLALRGPGIEPGRVSAQVGTPDLGALLLALADDPAAVVEGLPSRQRVAVGGLRRRGRADTFAFRSGDPGPGDPGESGNPEYEIDVAAAARAREQSHRRVIRPDEETRRALEALGYLD
jgi:arylsulfatase A-like enzyme